MWPGQLPGLVWLPFGAIGKYRTYSAAQPFVAIGRSWPTGLLWAPAAIRSTQWQHPEARPQYANQVRQIEILQDAGHDNSRDINMNLLLC